MATSTPWGMADSSKQIARGIMQYGTPSHGGIHVSKGMQAKMPDHLRNESGWYEEDCGWCLVAIAFPQFFDEKTNAAARDTFRNWFPFQYEVHYGVTLQPGESYIRDEEVFNAEHANDWIVIAASGDWHEKAKPGFCYVIATIGGRSKTFASQAEKAFLVPEAEYDNRSRYGFVIDPARHEEVSL